MAKKTYKIIFFITLVCLGLFLTYSFLFSHNTKPLLDAYYKEHFPYELMKPARMIPLPLEIREISGIAYYGENTLVGLEDEHGIIYKIDYLSGKITGQYPFAKDGDYEDITVAKNAVYTMRSSGKIFHVPNLGEKHEGKFLPDFEQVANAEGLCYDERRNILLVAFKRTTASYEQAGKKPIYAFDLATDKFLPDPVLVMDFDIFRKISGMKVSDEKFKASGIAIHPLTGNIYLISNTSKQLLVVNQDGDLIALVTLGNGIFRQPEGICFLPNGDMLISSEGKKSEFGYLLLFPYNSK